MPDQLLVLGLGSNLGDRLKFLKAARTLLESALGPMLAASQIYETEPWGVENHPSYLNQVLVFASSRQPKDILRLTQQIETQLGRSQKGLIQARTLDIDLLFYGQLILNSQELVLPHPRLVDRLFVLKPLSQVLPAFIHPQHGQSVTDLFALCKDTCKIWPYKPIGECEVQFVNKG